MRLALCLAAALTTVLCKIYPATRYLLEEDDALPDGSIVTIFFFHIGDHGDKDRVSINFYDRPFVGVAQLHDIPALIEVGAGSTLTSSFYKGKTYNQVDEKQFTDEKVPTDGWWRVDVIKHDTTHMSVFLQGFFAGVRTFEKPLDNLKSIYVESPHVNHSRTEIRMKFPTSKLAPLSVQQFKDSIEGDFTDEKRVVGMGSFLLNSSIELTVVLRASLKMDYLHPTLAFKANGEEFLKISQEWDRSESMQKLRLTSEPAETVCSSDKPNGDLQHLKLKRISKNVVEMRVFYNKYSGAKGKPCKITLPSDYAEYLNKPFAIFSHDGATLLHVHQSLDSPIEWRKPSKWRTD